MVVLAYYARQVSRREGAQSLRSFFSLANPACATDPQR